MNHTITALGWTLIHFLWQGAGIAALLAGARYILRKSSAQARYAAAMAALLLMLACAAATFLYLDSDDMAAPGQAQVTRTATTVGAAVASTYPQASSWRDHIPDYFPALVYIWFAGVFCLSLRSFGGWVAAQLWKRSHVRPADAFWQDRMTQLAKRLAISRTVRLWNSAVAQTPAVIGWIRPVVLLPASALSGLAPGQIEALLAHELAHIRRHDYLVNLLQTAVETLLFYHPAVWWVGHQMRAERENCCDDLAVAVCGDALVYARALTELEQIRIQAPRLAMAANDGSLLNRVRRLLESESDRARRASANHGDWFTVAAITLSAVSIWGISRAPIARQHGNLAPSVHVQNVLYRESSESEKRQSSARPDPRVRLIAMTQAAEQNEQATPGAPEEQSFAGAIAALGYKDLSVDQLISLKIHGVTTEYVRQLLAAGLKLKVDEIVAFAIHGANPADIVEMQKLGYKLTPDEIVSMQIHGLTPGFTRQMAAAGLGTPTFDQLIAFKIHGVTPEIAEQFKQAGVRELSFDNLVSLQIHGANPDNVKQIASLGYPNLSADDVVRMCIHGVDADFVRKAAKHGFKDLTLEKLIKLKQFGILD